MKGKIESFFKLKEHNTNIQTEVIAGITTFVTIAYILVVNPSILSAGGMDSGAVFTATAVTSSLWHCQQIILSSLRRVWD